MNVKKTTALETYLTDLLSTEVPKPSRAKPELKVEDSQPLLNAQLERLLATIPVETPIKSVAPVTTVHNPPLTQEPQIDQRADPVTESIASQDKILTAEQPVVAISQFEATLPEEFQALIFWVGKLQLALPLHLLGGIVKKTETPTPLFGNPEWFEGLLTTSTGTLQVVDTGQYLFNERYTADMRANYQFVVRIADSLWGLSVTELCTTKLISKSDIRWFPDHNGRPWIAGMLKEEKCALLNSAALTARFLNESQKKPSNTQKASMLEQKSALKRRGTSLTNSPKGHSDE